MDELDHRYCPDESEWFVVLEWWDTPHGDKVAPRMVLLGSDENPLNKIPLELPRPPDDPKLIRNNGLPRNRQVWKRAPLHPEWEVDSIIENAIEHHKRDNLWWRDHATQAMQDYVAEQRRLRKEGEFIWINGRITWLPGPYWFFLQWEKIDIGYPEYIDKQLRLFYVLEYIWLNKKNFGVLYLKRRREGGTYCFMGAAVERITRTKNAMFGMQGNSKEETEKEFQQKVVPIWKELPLFFKPENDGLDDPKSGLSFKVAAHGGKRKVELMGTDSGLGSFIQLAATKRDGKVTFDGKKMHIFFRDEWAKSERENIYDTWLTLRETMADKSGVIGRAMYPSTVEDMSDENTRVAEELWDNSEPSKRLTSGFTESGLIRYFTPAYDGLYIEGVSFIGPYGESVVGPPTEEQLAFLIKQQPDNKEIFESGGSWAYLVRQRKESKGRSLEKRKRQYPFTPRDAFRADSDNSLINPIVINDCKEKLLGMNGGIRYADKLMIRGRLEFKEWVESSGKRIEVLKSDVVFFPDPNGNWEVRADFINSTDWIRNHVVRTSAREGHREKYGHVYLHDQSRYSFAIGIDPTDRDVGGTSVKKRELSKFALVAVRKYNEGIEMQEGCAGTTFSPVMMYRHRSESVTDDFKEAAKCMIFLGSKAHIESNRGAALFKQLKDWGLEKMIRWRPDTTYKQNAKHNPVPGTPTSDDLYDLGIPMVNEWVTHHCTPENNPFIHFYVECQKLDRKDMQPFDIFVAFMFALFDSGGGILAQPDKNKDIGGGDDWKPSTTSNWKARGHHPDKYRIRK